MKLKKSIKPAALNVAANDNLAVGSFISLGSAVARIVVSVGKSMGKA